MEEKIKDNFDLSPRGIREMLKLNKPIYEKLLPMDILVENPNKAEHFLGKKQINQRYFLNRLY